MHSQDTQSESSEKPVLLPAIEHLGLPVFLFGVSFLLITALVTNVLAPDRFPVKIGDHVVRLIDLESEQQALLSRRADLQATSQSAVSNRSPILHRVQELQAGIPPVGVVLLALDDARQTFKTAALDPVSLTAIALTASGTQIVIAGSVRDAAGTTMKTLAAFVDRLRAIPEISSVSEPEYVQQNDVDGVPMSPFSITLSLRHAAS